MLDWIREYGNAGGGCLSDIHSPPLILTQELGQWVGGSVLMDKSPMFLVIRNRIFFCPAYPLVIEF